LIAGPEGITRERYAPRAISRSVCSSTSTSRAPIRSYSAATCRESRENLGRLLARECPAEADLVVPVPDSGVSAAIATTAERVFPFRQALIRNTTSGASIADPCTGRYVVWRPHVVVPDQRLRNGRPDSAELADSGGIARVGPPGPPVGFGRALRASSRPRFSRDSCTWRPNTIESGREK